ncbi:MAG TPA: hypothetical protein EYP17_08270 [Candidatus Latescibacteria bacterium]|nr:hypothetical protein [Candidatus Latescibacterota bacterium]
MMKAVAVGDLHGHWGLIWELLEREQPDLLLSCGDWGDPDQVREEDFGRIVARIYLLTVFGNHDDIELLGYIRNRDGSPVLLGREEVRKVLKLRVAGIGGIWAKSHRKPWYITDEEVAEIAGSLEGKGIDILITHACPIGLADLTPTGRHGGQRCFLEAFRLISPKVHLCGHLHRKALRRLKSGAVVANVGHGAEGDFLYLLKEGDMLQVEDPKPT